MKEHKEETYDITSSMILIFFIIIHLVRLTKHVKVILYSRINL